jgi:hypothetical protein
MVVASIRLLTIGTRLGILIAARLYLVRGGIGFGKDLIGTYAHFKGFVKQD